MRIKRLDITGFKSFMERVVFSFDDGITAVVGPNGCGKSNVVDAIRWAMGEQSAKSLRGRGMEDVIFNGSETHPPLSMAEVTLTFAVSSDDVLPPPLAGLPEVAVTRRLFRSGESEYQINRTPCRLLDVTELFLGTGVGTKAYSIIEQGRVGQIVSARPEDRRAFIEEAAGITKYKARRRAAERKLEYTEQNLVRVADLVRELERRSDSLERQAKKAEKHKRLKGELRGIELHAQALRYLELRAERARIAAELASVGGEERARLELLRSTDDALARRREEGARAAQALEALSSEYYALEAQVQLDVQNAAHWTEDLEATRERVSGALSELEAHEARRRQLEAELESQDAELKRMGVASREDEVTLRVREEELRRNAELLTAAARRLDDERRSLAELAARAANDESRRASLDARRAEAAQRQREREAELEALRREEAELEAARAEVLERLALARQASEELAARRGEEEAALERIRASFAENELRVIALREELADRRSRLQSLEELHRTYEGLDRGVRAVMGKIEADPRGHGVFGLVSDALSVPERYERAVAAALGERLQHVLVESLDRGVELVEFLRADGEGRSTFVPVPAEPLPAAEAGAAPEGAVVAAEVAEAREEALAGVVRSLLARTAIVGDLGEARAAAARAPDWTFVTVEGDVLRPGGVLTGGLLEGPAAGAFQKRRELVELGAAVTALEERYNELVTRHYELQKQLGSGESVLKGLERTWHSEELTATTHERDLHQATTGLVRLRERIAATEGLLSQLGATERALALELESVCGELLHTHAERQGREARLQEQSGELTTLRARAEAIAAEATELKVKVAAVSERGESARRAVDQLVAQLDELGGRAERLEAAIAEGRARLGELEGRLGSTAADRAARQARLDEARGELERRKEEHARHGQALREDEVALRELREQVEGLHAGLSAMTLRERELALELEHLGAQVRERHGVEVAEAVHQYHLERPPGEAAQERLRELRAQLEKLGEVNLTAIDEHREIAERLAFLSKQKADLEASLLQLREAIQKIDTTSRARFKETFEVINEKFQQVFPRLFGGGRASLLLVAGAAGDEPGVEILAQPPGKKLQSVGLLSGGEKALTAVALIFGIFLIKPTPFCLLDEVDAPLDEGNVGRYNDMVREMSTASQFILITHNKRTMEVADSLYGVTMEEPGVSKLVSVRLREAVAVNGDQQVA